jgi:membrane associated rhomboid family serine protease
MFPIKNAVPTRYPPVVTWLLIATNCVVFFLQLDLSPSEEEWLLFRYALIPARYFTYLPIISASTPADYLPFLTMMFLHGGWLHLILNMWTLWLFGAAVEDRMGHGRFLAFYLVCGILAGLAHAVFNATSTVPALGASGAIAGLLGCYVRLFPTARLVVVVPIVIIPFFFEVPAILYVGFWFVMQILQGTAEMFSSANTGGGVAWWAHIGGFFAGLVLGPLMVRSEQRYRAYYPDEGVLGFDAWGRR